MFVIGSNFSYDELTHPPTPLKTESTTDILIKQVHKFQNSFFKERMLKAATATKSHIVSEYATKYALLLKLN